MSLVSDKREFMYKRKSDGLWCQKVPTGSGYRVIYGRTQRDLKDKLKNLKADVPTFADCAEMWEESHCAGLSPGRQRSYHIAATRAAEAFGRVSVDSLRAVDITRFLAILARKKGISKKTVENHLSVIRQILQFAILEGFCDYNPAHDARIPEGLPSHPRPLPSPEDIRKVKEHPEGFGLFALIALYTGLRRGEILALRRDDIDLDRRLIYVTKSLRADGANVTLKLPKTESGVRVVGIPEGLLPHLQNLPEGLLFQTKGRPLTAKQFELRWKSYSEETGIKATPHQFRHAYTTALIESGISPVEAQRLLGHSNFATTMNIYHHFRKEKDADIARKTLTLEP